MGWFEENFLGQQDAGAARSNYLKDIDTGTLHQSATDSMDFGKGLMNYTSEYNRGMKRDYMNQAMDMGENQMRNYQKSFAMGGKPVNQAMLNERNQAVTKDSTNRGLAQFTQAYRQNLGMGRDFVNQGLNTLGQYNTIMGNANQVEMGVNQQNAQNRSQFWQGAMATGINAMAPGLGSLMGGGTFGEGYSMPRELMNAQMNWYNKKSPEIIPPHVPKETK